MEEIRDCVAPRWNAFIQESWERSPTTFVDPGTRLCESQETFAAISEAARDLREGRVKDYRDVRVYLGELVLADPGPYLPVPEERTLDEYIERIEAKAGDQPFGILFNNYHQFSRALSLRMRLFARSLFDQLGMLPAGTVTSHLMIGRYPASPFGVHKDPNSVFTFIVRGKKTLRVWPFETFADRRPVPFAKHRQLNLYNFDYRPFKELGIPLEGEPGNILYWPSGYWHVGEGDGETHISLHVTYDVHSEPRGETVDILRRYVEETTSETADWHAGYPIDSVSRSGRVQVPAQLMQAVSEFSKSLATSIPESVAALWLSRMSAQGFWSVPAPSISPAFARACLDGGGPVRADPSFPSYWNIADGIVSFAAHGRVVRFPLRDWTARLLDFIRRREPFRVHDIVAEFSGDSAVAAARELNALSEKLFTIGALESFEEA